jgi:hypothetical protein
MKADLHLALVIVFLVGCSPPSNSDEFALSALKEDIRDQKSISLRTYTTFDWDKVYVFPPYTHESLIKEDTGTKVKFPHSDSEGHCLLVFTNQGQVIKEIEVQRSRADFSMLYRKEGYSRDEADFNVVVDKHPIQSWWYLKPK